MNSGPLFPFLYCGSIFVGGFLYSAPPFRFKNNHFTALLCNYALYVGTTPGFYYACKAGLGLPVGWSPAFCLLFWFVSLFAVPISISKDLPDIEGDRKFGITTFPTEYGPKTIAFICHGLVLLNYVGLDSRISRDIAMSGVRATTYAEVLEKALEAELCESRIQKDNTARWEARKASNGGGDNKRKLPTNQHNEADKRNKIGSNNYKGKKPYGEGFLVVVLAERKRGEWRRLFNSKVILLSHAFMAIWVVYQVRPKKQMPTSCYPLSFLGNLIEGLVGKDKLEVLKIAACIFTEG
ncbi:hypothetical protein G4B88_003478 [Cannabis sativa]|uniref:Uncharacterized protein n=1 Tax=Cannabis sativa TaxID=3483 RepID=A0A7J6GTZ8_CANSA|nr:hypothetical protein G4B88_003478 [Cannabis sativa]